LVVSVEVWSVVLLTGFHEHADDNSVESREFGHTGYVTSSRRVVPTDDADVGNASRPVG
jgi:hypothetical protein